MKLSLTLLSVNGPKAVVTHFVHETIKQHLRTTFIDTKFACGSVVIVFLDVLTLLRATSNTDHPQEFVDVCNKNKLISPGMYANTDDQFNQNSLTQTHWLLTFI